MLTEEKIKKLEATIGHTFDDQRLLHLALRHRSCPASENNERLEFLGDAVVSLVIGHYLYTHYEEVDEGELSRLRARLVNGEHLAVLASRMHLNDFLEVGAGEIKRKGGYRTSLLADAFEAVVGAVYLDSNYDVCEKVVRHLFGDTLENLSLLIGKRDAKSELQEYAQARRFSLPDYSVLKTEGAQHAQKFHVQCCIKQLPIETIGVGSSRRRAEQDAAQKFLDKLERE